MQAQNETLTERFDARLIHVFEGRWGQNRGIYGHSLSMSIIVFSCVSCLSDGVLQDFAGVAEW